MFDSYGDSWNGNVLTIKDQAGTTIFSHSGPDAGCEGACTYADDCPGSDADNPNGIPCYASGTFSTMPAVYGCTDASSTCNYDATATADDGSCQYDLGCGCGGPAPGETCACPRAGGIGAWELDQGETSWTSFTAEPGVYNIDVTSSATQYYLYLLALA